MKMLNEAWSDQSFKELSSDARLVYLYLISNYRTSILEGFLRLDSCIIGDDIGWRKGRVNKALAELYECRDERGYRFAICDERHVIIPKMMMCSFGDEKLMLLEDHEDSTIKLRLINLLIDMPVYIEDDEIEYLNYLKNDLIKKGYGQIKREKVEQKTKPVNAPESFTYKQKKIFDLFKKSDFMIQGQGTVSAYDALEDPVDLAMRLGDENIFPNVKPEKISELSIWSLANPKRAKKDLRRFLLNRFNAENKYGNKNNGQNGSTPNFNYTDLAASILP